MRKTKIVITVEGGVVQGIMHDNKELRDYDIEVCVLDFDCDGQENVPEITTFYGGKKERCNIYEDSSRLNKDFVDHYFNELEKVRG